MIPWKGERKLESSFLELERGKERKRETAFSIDEKQIGDLCPLGSMTMIVCAMILEILTN